MLKLIQVDTVALPVKLRLPTGKPGVFNEGSITGQVRIKSKDEIAALIDKGASDSELVQDVLVSVDGLGDGEGNPVTGEAALTEVFEGPWSNFLVSGIAQAYFEQFGEARVKNSRPSRGR